MRVLFASVDSNREISLGKPLRVNGSLNLTSDLLTPFFDVCGRIVVRAGLRAPMIAPIFDFSVRHFRVWVLRVTHNHLPGC
jgi:hypothetical protein